MELKPENKKRSIVWKSFEDVDGIRAKCRACKRELSYRGGNVFNLSRHRDRCRERMKSLASGLILDDINTSDVAVKPFRGNSSKSELRTSSYSSKKKSNIWIYFEDLGSRKFKCTLCSKVFSVQQSHNTSNLRRHLKRFHPDKYIDKFGAFAPSSNSLKEQDVSKGQRSAWKYFKKLSSENAQCNICSEAINCNEIIGHIRVAHGIEIIDLETDVEFIETLQADNIFVEDSFFKKMDEESSNSKSNEGSLSGFDKDENELAGHSFASASTTTERGQKKNYSKEVERFDLDERPINVIADRLNPLATNLHFSFGQYVADQLTMLRPSMVSLCKRIINEAIYEADIGHLTKYSRILNKPPVQLENCTSQTDEPGYTIILQTDKQIN